MDRFRTPDQVPSSIFSPRGVRSRIAMVMVGLMSATACKISLGTGEKCRCAAVNKPEKRVMPVPETGAVIHLKRSTQDEEGKIEGMLDIPDSSPLLTPSEEIREYELLPEARPWTRIVVEPAGRIILQFEGSQLAVLFECPDLSQGKATSCKGAEGDPKELDEEIAAIEKKYEDAGADGSDADASTDTDADAVPAEAGSDGGDADASADASSDASADAGASVPSDASADAGTDAPAEAGPQK